MASDGYIKKSDAESALFALRKVYRRVEEKCAIGACILEIGELPTANVKEVVHGSWSKPRLIVEEYDIWGRDCSECGCICGVLKSNYCPNCGAKMDGG